MQILQKQSSSWFIKYKLYIVFADSRKCYNYTQYTCYLLQIMGWWSYWPSWHPDGIRTEYECFHERPSREDQVWSLQNVEGTTSYYRLAVLLWYHAMSSIYTREQTSVIQINKTVCWWWEYIVSTSCVESGHSSFKQLESWWDLCPMEYMNSLEQTKRVC